MPTNDLLFACLEDCPNTRDAEVTFVDGATLNSTSSQRREGDSFSSTIDGSPWTAPRVMGQLNSMAEDQNNCQADQLAVVLPFWGQKHDVKVLLDV